MTRCRSIGVAVTRIAAAGMVFALFGGCGVASSEPAQGSEAPSAAGELTASALSSKRAALSAAYAGHAATYRQLAEKERQATSFGWVAPKQTRFWAPSKAVVGVDRAAERREETAAKRRRLAALADRLAATAQQAADFYLRNATALAVAEGTEVRQ